MRELVLGALKEQRGTAVLLVLGFMIFLLAMVGFAVDLGYQMAAIGEVQRSMEAAALAGAGKLGFNDTVFPTARDFAQTYARLNPYHNTFGNLVQLDLNTANAAGGNIVLGIWDGTARTFTPSLDGTSVNAVRCQWNTTIPTAFLRVIGILSLPVSAQAIAISNPPQNPPPDTCMFPIGVSACAFNGPTSLGCGSTVTFISSSDESAVGANTAAWVSLTTDSNANAAATKTAVQNAGAGACPSDLKVGDTIDANNGMAQSVYDTTFDIFVQKYNSSPIYTVYKQDGTTVAYQGKGWEVYVPVIDTGAGCPPGAVNGSKQIVGFTRMVITQVAKQNGDCAVANHAPENPWDARCFVDKNGTATSLSPGVTGSRGIYGYYDCTVYPSNPTPEPVPRTALATKLRLVKTY